MRHIVFVGLGSFGYHCARKLEGKAEVTAIDRDRRAIQRIGPFVTRAVVGDGTKRELLDEMGVQTADAAVVSLGDRMDASILATLHLRSMGIKEIFVKSISDEHSQILELIGATRVIHPEREMAENLAVSILEPAVVDYLRLHEGFGIIEVHAPREFWGKNLIELDLRRLYGITVLAIVRDPDQRIVNPSADATIRSDDKLMILGAEEQILKFQGSLNSSGSRTR